MISMQDPLLKDRHLTLKQFAHNYASMIEVNIESSFHYRSPKIDANYDEYESKTLRPLNATFFHYFFGASKFLRMFALDFFLSAYRYPNERIR
jgi:hypothetical protein